MLYFFGNWRMNKTKSEITQFFVDFELNLAANENKQIIILPPFCYLDYTKNATNSMTTPEKKNMISFGAQFSNIGSVSSADFRTGQITPPQLKDCSAEYIMVGNAGCKEYFGITNETIGFQVNDALNSQMKVVLCVGEKIAEREAGQTQAVLDSQITAALNGLTAAQSTNVFVVYEPIWAIGTGKTCSPTDFAEAADIIYNKLNALTFSNIPILYGGSINTTTVTASSYIQATPRCYGVLVGAGSYLGERFANIINAT